MNCSCPGWRKGSPGEEAAEVGQSVRKSRDWLANFDLSLMARRCKQTSALFPSEHEHVQLRGTVRTSEGSLKLATFSGRYSDVESALYAAAVKAALRRIIHTEEERVDTRLRRRLSSGQASADPPAVPGRGPQPGQARGSLAALSGSIKPSLERGKVLSGRSGPAVPTTPRKGAPVETAGEALPAGDTAQEETSYIEKER